MIVYEKLGVRILQRAWFNFDLAWAVALIVSGLVTAVALTVPTFAARLLDSDSNAFGREHFAAGSIGESARKRPA